MVDCSFDIPAENFSIKFPKVFVQNPKLFSSKPDKTWILFEKLSFPNFFAGHVECNFDNYVKISSFKIRKLFARSPTKFSIFWKKLFFPKSFSGHVEMSFENISFVWHCIYSICRILKSSFNNRQRRIESLRSFSNLFLNCSTTTPLNTCTRSTRRGIGGASTKNL